jgi:tripartite-type tricarboxylate transporter receptor subunit TctC
VPVTLLASSPSVVVVPGNSPIKSIGDLIARAKEKPGSVMYASAGVGTCTFLAAELFKRQAKVDMLHVPYKGGGPAVTATLSGEANVYFAPVPPVMPHIKAGALRALAVSSPKSLDTLPDYKPIAESGVPGYEFSCWYGLFVPAGTPKPLVNTLHSAIVSVLKDAGSQ